MLKKTIKYEDFNGEEASEDFFFHLSKAELVELELSHKGGLSESLKKIVEAEDGKAIIAEFKNIILGAYGKRSDDGRRFVKNQELRDDFESSEAYSVLFMELVTNAEAAAEFINGIIPQNLAEEAAKITRAELAVVEDPQPADPEPEATPAGPKVVTRADVMEMTVDEVQQLGNRVRRGEIVIDMGDGPSKPVGQ